MKRLLCALFLSFLFFCRLAEGAEPGKVIVAPLSGTVGVQMEQFVARVIAQAEDEGAGLIVFRLNTPGGLVEATRGIIQSILASKVPIALWVPPGARAASAGAFMMQAAHIAAMSLSSNLGAAHPVEASGGDLPSADMKKKITNDLTAQMRYLAQLRGRNGKIAQRMVVDSLSLTAKEAYKEKVIDLVVENLDTLLAAARGRTVMVDGQKTTVSASVEAVFHLQMTLQEQLIQFLSSPDIAYLLLVGGLMALFYEILTPGGFILGTTGAVMLLLGSIGLKMLPFNWAGVALVGAGVLVMGMDLLVGGTGLLSLLGVAVIVTGGVFLFRTPGAELLSVSLAMMAGMAIALGLCFTFFAMLIAKSLRSPVTTGEKGLIGLEVLVTEALDPEGMVKCHGEVWKARAETGCLSQGAYGIVSAVEGLTLLVRPKE